jgi:hypothetical protein
VPRVRHAAAVLAAVAVAGGVASARADDAPGSFSGHGVKFTYPSSWSHIPATFVTQIGSALWTESFAPVPAPDPSQPSQPKAKDLVVVASYHTNVSITKKTLPRYRRLIQAAVVQLAAQAGGTVVSGPQRSALGKFAGYRFEVTATLPDASLVQSRLVFAFNKRTEYFLNCQHVQNGPLSDEIEAGCDQVAKSFRLGR